MAIEPIVNEFRQRISDKVEIEAAGHDTYRVLTPFMLPDGDHLSVILRRVGGTWELTDEGMTLMRLTYRIDADDLMQGNRLRIINDALSMFDVENRQGELAVEVQDERFGDALYDFIQALLRISDVSLLSREHVRSTFKEDLESTVRRLVPEPLLVPNWSDPQHDPEGKSPVDYWVERDYRPVAIFGLPNDGKVKDATITLLQLEKWGRRIHSIGVFENQEEIPPRTLARFGDVADKTFSALVGDSGQRFRTYLADLLASPSN
jgi:hypothetical protein